MMIYTHVLTKAGRGVRSPVDSLKHLARKRDIRRYAHRKCHMTEHEYHQILKPHARALRQLLLDLEYFLQDVGELNVFSVSSRLKSYQSALAKSNTMGIPASDLHDLAGLRVVVGTKHDVEIVSRFFSRQEVSKDLEIMSDRAISRKNGYRARHIVVLCKGDYKRSMYPGRVEAQIQTIFEHAFNFLSRAWVYKSAPRFSPQWEGSFRELSAQLEKIERIANDLHVEVLDSSMRDSPGEPLSPFSYRRIVKAVFGDELSIDDAVDGCRYFGDIGCDSNQKLVAFFTDKRIEILRQRFMRAKSKPGQIIGQNIAESKPYLFWMMFGVRYESAIEMLNDFEASAPKGNISSPE
jgi:ppGpp synthetase/RelA/SpoT-type nucleotidyltranferase